MSEVRQGVSDWTVNQLTGSMAAEVIGCDLRSVNESDFPELDRLLTRYHVLAFRGQQLSDDDLMRFGNLWGPLRKFAGDPSMTRGDGYIIVLRNEGFIKKSDGWHTEVPMAEEPPRVTILRAEKLPPAGGDTLFANQHLALKTLSPAFQEMLRPLKAVHRIVYGDDRPDLEMAQPVVSKHPITGEEVLYLGGTAHKFEGMSEEESKPILDFLLNHSIDDNFIYRHRWQEGDVVMWDNRSVIHRSTRDYGEDADARQMSNVQAGPIRVS